MAKKMLEISASELVRTSMETYAKEVIEDRSLPDFRDGLKISQRRILYYMWSESISSDGNFKASANVIGGVLGRLHPHGDMSVYQTIVTMNNNTISPVHGDGDGWGSIQTEASAMRYTKTKLSSFGDLFCKDILIAEFVPNYSGDWKEPIVIPAPLPYALLAGTSGIAVAVATSIPSHNLTELVTTFLKVLKGEQDIEKLVGTTLLAPESKTGGVVISTLDELRDVYRAGKGKVRWRCDYDVVYDKKDDSWSLVVTGIPEAFALDSWLTKMKQHAQTGMVQIENESCADDPIRYVVNFNNIAFFHDVIEPALYCTDNYNFNLIAKAGERATDMSLHHHSFLSWVDAWLTWREDIEVKIVKDKISKLESDLVRENTKYWATSHIDSVIDTIRKSRNPQADLKSAFKLNDIQAKIIAEMPLQAISKLSQEKLSKSISSMQEELSKDYQRLTQPKKLIEATLKSLLQHDKKGRIAKIDYGDAQGQKVNKALRKSEGKPNYWAIETARPKSLHQIGPELSLRKRVLNPYLNIVNAQTGVITVSEKGEIKRWGLSELAERDHSCSYVNILSPESQQIVLSLNNGLWGNFWMEQKASSWTTKLIHSGEDKILSAVGVTRGDILWVYSANLVESVFCDWEPFSRSNKSGWKGKGGKEIRLFVIPKDHSLVIDSKMVRYSFSDLVTPSRDITQRFLKAKFYYLFNPKEDKPLLCIAQDGTRSFLTGTEIANSSLDLIQTFLV